MANDQTNVDAPRDDIAYAWLIEMTDAGRPTYWCRLDDEDGVCGWSKDHDKALRFCRAQDAQAIIDEYGWTEPKPVEHAWDMRN